MRTVPTSAAIALSSRRMLRGGELGAAGRIAAAVLAYVALACLGFWPVGPFDAAQLPNGHLGDPVQMTWFLSYTAFALAHGHNLFANHLIDYPTGVNLAQNTSVPLLGTIGAPVTWTLGPIAAFNTLARLAIALSAGAMFAVLRTWCRSDAAAFVGGLCYGFSPYVAAHLQGNGHLNLIFVPFPPLFSLLVYEVALRQEHSALGRGAVLGLLATAQLLVSPEVLSDCALVALVFLLASAVQRPRLVRTHLRHAGTAFAAALGTFAVLGALPLYWMLFGAGHLRAPVQAVAQLQAYHADLLQALLPSPRALVAPVSLHHAFVVMTAPIAKGGGGAELGGYLGLPLVAALVAVVILFRRSAVVRAFATLGLVAYLLSLGSHLQVDGHVSAIPLPEALLAHLPLLDNTVPSRFALEVALGTSALLAVGLDGTLSAIGRAGGRRRALKALGATLALVVVLVGVAPRLPLSRERPALGPSLTRAVDALPSGVTLLTYPYPEPPYDEAMLWQSLDAMRFTLMGGYATVVGNSGASQTWPPLLKPPSVQELWSFAMFHTALRYPPPTVHGAAAVHQLCTFLSRYRIGDVAALSTRAGAGAPVALLRSALGSPRDLGGGLLVWATRGARGC